MKQKLIVILGPTASGKTAFSLKLAKKFEGYIISADSRQIYQGMDIGTAKVSKEERLFVNHYLIDVVLPNQEYTLSHFKKDILKIIKEQKGLPFLVGGTGLYLDSIIYNLTLPNIPPDKKLREEIVDKISKKGLEPVYQELINLDPEALNIVDSKNPRRIIRALEVSIKSNHPFSSFYKKGPRLFNLLLIGIMPRREELYRRIDKRVDQMIKEGLIDETKGLIEKYDKKLPSMSTLGYRQIIPYLEGKTTREEAIENIKRETRKYAKRQITWFKRYRNIHWISNKEEGVKIVRDFLISKV